MTTIPAKPWAIYVRVSDDEQAEEGVSIDAQKAACAQYAKDRGWTVAVELVDDGYTGRTAKRPGYTRLLDLLKRRAVAGVIAWKLKRLSRNARLVLDLMDLLNKTGTEMATVVERWDTTSPTGRAMVAVGAVFAQLESEDNGVQTSAAMTYLRKHGFYTGGVVPVGLKVEIQPDGKRRKLVRSDDAETVSKAWGWIMAGDSLLQVGERLTKAGIKAPGRGTQPSKGWTGVAVRNLLLSKQVVPLLVDAGMQAAVRHRLSTRGNPMRRAKAKEPGSRAEFPSPLTGRLRCPTCEAAMIQVTATGNGGIYRYFRCCERIKGRCKQKDVRAEHVEKTCMEAIADACQPGGVYQQNLRTMLLAAKDKLADARAERAKLLSQRDLLSARITDMALHQQIGAGAWNEAMKALGSAIDQVDTRLAELHGSIAVAEVDRGSLDMVLAGIAGSAARLPSLTMADQTVIIREILDTVRIQGDDVILDLYRPQAPENNETTGNDPGGSSNTRLWLPATHRRRTDRYVISRRSAIRASNLIPGRELALFQGDGGGGVKNRKRNGGGFVVRRRDLRPLVADDPRG